MTRHATPRPRNWRDRRWTASVACSDPRQPDTLWSMVILASIFYDEGRLADAEKLYRDALDIRRRVLGPDHPDTLSLMDGYATTLAVEHATTKQKNYCAKRSTLGSVCLAPTTATP